MDCIELTGTGATGIGPNNAMMASLLAKTEDVPKSAGCPDQPLQILGK